MGDFKNELLFDEAEDEVCASDVQGVLVALGRVASDEVQTLADVQAFMVGVILAGREQEVADAQAPVDSLMKSAKVVARRYGARLLAEMAASGRVGHMGPDASDLDGLVDLVCERRDELEQRWGQEDASVRVFARRHRQVQALCAALRPLCEQGLAKFAALADESAGEGAQGVKAGLDHPGGAGHLGASALH